MPRCKRPMLLVAAMLAMLAGGCLSSGRQQSSRTGSPSPSFGLNYVPRQSEPPVESVAEGQKSTGSQTSTPRIDATADLDEATGDRPGKTGNGKTGNGKTGNKLVSWLPGQDNKPAERKPLPLSDRSPVATDDDQLEP